MRDLKPVREVEPARNRYTATATLVESARSRGESGILDLLMYRALDGPRVPVGSPDSVESHIGLKHLGGDSWMVPSNTFVRALIEYLDMQTSIAAQGPIYDRTDGGFLYG